METPTSACLFTPLSQVGCARVSQVCSTVNAAHHNLLTKQPWLEEPPSPDTPAAAKVPAEFLSALTQLPEQAVRAGSCDMLLRRVGPAEMRAAVQLVAKAYQAMGCAAFAEEQQLAEQAAALLERFAPELERYCAQLAA